MNFATELEIGGGQDEREPTVPHHPRGSRFATCALLAALAFATCACGQTYTFVGTFGGAVSSANGQFNGPNWVAIDPSSHDIIVTDQSNNRVEVFSSTGAFINAFGGAGSGNGQLNAPRGVAVDPVNQNIVVADYNNNRVQVFNAAGAYLSKFGSLGTGNGLFNNVATIAIDPTSRNIVVTDGIVNTTFDRAQIFDATGVYLSQFGSRGSGNGQFSPGGVAIDPTSHNIVIADRENNRIEIFSSLGVFQSAFGAGGTGNGQLNNPSGVAVDPSTHNILVADSGNNRIQIFNSSGLYISQFGSTGSGPGQFKAPNGIAIDPTSLNLVVADFTNNRVQIFAPSGGGAQPITPQVGLWWNPAESGSGYALDVKHGVLVVTVYSYTAAGAPIWYLASGPITNNVFTSTLDKYSGGQCISCAYQPTAINGNDGTIGITFTSPTSAMMTLPGGRSFQIVPQAF